MSDPSCPRSAPPAIRSAVSRERTPGYQGSRPPIPAATEVLVIAHHPRWLSRLDHATKRSAADSVADAQAMEDCLRDWRDAREPLEFDAETVATLQEHLGAGPSR